jgi:hypothetical protein
MTGWIDETAKGKVQVASDVNWDTDVIEKPKAQTYLFYGDTGSGKTYLGFTFPEPIFVIDTEARAINTKHYNFPDKKIIIKQPIEFKTEFNSKDDDPLDTHKTIETITKLVIDFANKVKSGSIKEGTLILDSASDLWTLIQDWGVFELAKYTNKDGSKKADTMMMRVGNQLDWKIMNKRHTELVGILRQLNKYGIYIVFTAREDNPPEYAVKVGNVEVKDKIRAQKDLPFVADVTINMKKTQQGQTIKYMGFVEKLSGKPKPTQPIENPTFEKLQEALK